MRVVDRNRHIRESGTASICILLRVHWRVLIYLPVKHLGGFLTTPDAPIAYLGTGPACLYGRNALMVPSLKVAIGTDSKGSANSPGNPKVPTGCPACSRWRGLGGETMARPEMTRHAAPRSARPERIAPRTAPRPPTHGERTRGAASTVSLVSSAAAVVGLGAVMDSTRQRSSARPGVTPA